MNTKVILKALTFPLLLLFLYSIFYLGYNALGLPSESQIFEALSYWFAKYGLFIVFFGAMLEGVLLVGNYFPGGLIIFIGVLSAGKDITKVIEVVIVVSLAFFISYFFNYMLGKYGWYKLLLKFGASQIFDKYKSKVEKQGLNVVFFTYWLPNLASLTATSAGILRFPISKFLVYSAFGITLWSIFWGTLIYNLGRPALEILGLKFVFVLFAIWIGIILIRKLFIKKQFLNSSTSGVN